MYSFRLGIISTLLSEAFVNGFTTAAAVHVLLSQIFDLIGLSSKKPKGKFKLMKVYPFKLKKNIVCFSMRLILKIFQTLFIIFNDIPYVNTAAVIISLIACFIMVINNEFIKVCMFLLEISNFLFLYILIENMFNKANLLFKKNFQPWASKKCSLPIPIELMAVVIGTLVSTYFELPKSYGIKTVGTIPIG